MTVRLVVGIAAVAVLSGSIVWGRWSLPKARRSRADLLRRYQGRTLEVHVGPRGVISHTGRVVEVDEADDRPVLEIGRQRRSILLSDVTSVYSALGTRLDDW